MKRLTGLIAATMTPMSADGAVDYDRIPALVEHLLADGVEGFYIIGSTGEGVSLTNHERCQAAEMFVDAVAGRQPVIVQVGHTSLAEAGALARHAAKIGADAVSATPPFYFRPNSVAALTDCMAEIATSAADLPFYYYHIPHVTGVTVDMPSFLERAGDCIPNFAGIKFTSFAIWEYQACLELDQGRFDCLYGHDEMLLPALAVGAQGAVGSTYNFATPLYQRVIKAFADGDLPAARTAQAKAIEMIRILLKMGGLPAMKATMELAGLDCGPVRAPLINLTEADRQELKRQLDEIGFRGSIRQPQRTLREASVRQSDR